MSPSPEAQICEKCGTRIETTGSGEIGCLSCLLRAGLESGEVGQSEEIPDSLGTYRIEHREDGRPWTLGQGTMGVTYRTYDTSLRRPVALKLIKADFARQSPQARERFLREARAAASLRHPHVATIYQFGIDEDSGQYFCAMELVDGETLDEYVKRHGPLKVAAVLEIARQIASALVAAEKQRVVHRDLKPGNIMISTEEETGKISVKVIDFGLAKALDASDDTRVLTEGGFLGTPAFASPEQLRRDPVDVRSDVYSLGATLWYLLTGKLPFGDQAKAGPPVEQLKAVRAPRPLVALLVAMLAADPGARPSGLEIVGRLDLLSRPSRRRPLVLAVVGSILAAAALFYFRPTAHPPLAPVAMPLAKSIAVLPFENLGNDEQDAAFAEGMQEDLLTNLAHISELKVVSRASVLRYGDVQKRNLREIGRQLGVAFVIEGAIRREGQRVRTSAQLVDVRTDQVLWAQTYERSIDDVFAIQSEISQSIAGQLGAKIAPREKNAIEAPPTRDLTVFALYTRANLLLPDTAFSSHGKAQLLRAAQLLGEAVARDPSFLLAWCQLAKADDSLYFLGFDRTSIRLSLAESAVNTALKLGPESGEAHLARARHLYQGYLAYEPALAEVAIARETLSNYPGLFTLTARIYRHQGKWQESAVEFENALSLDPRNVDIFKQIAISFNLQRRYADEAITLDRGLAIAPEDVGLRITRALVEFNRRADTRPLHALLTAVLQRQPAAAPDLAGVSLLLGLCERDQARIEAALTALGDGAFGVDAVQLRRLFWEGLAAKVRGDSTDATRAFTEARAEQTGKTAEAPSFAPGLCMLGLIDAGLGNKAKAIEEAHRAVELLPVARDPVNGAHMVEFLAVVYAWTGEPELACDQLDAVLKIPGTLSYGQLQLLPFWDDLRGNPRFKKIVAALAPDARP